MRKFLLISVLYLFVMQGFSQSPRIGVYYPDNNKCAKSGVSARVNFKDESLNNPVSRVWTIPAASFTSTEPSFEYFFNAPGDYWIVLEVTWATITRKDSVKITIYPMPVFSISKNNTDSICPRGSIPFSFATIPAADVGKVAKIVWDFGDNTPRDNSPSPNHVYVNGGNRESVYNVSLEITDINGCVSTVDSMAFIYVRSKPEASFTTNGEFFCFDKGPREATVDFTNETDIARPWAINTYLWDFGDGGTSNQENPSHVYSHVSGGSNTYIPKLIAKDQYNCVDTFVFNGDIRLNQMSLFYDKTDLPICRIPDTLTLNGRDLACNYRWDIINNRLLSSGIPGQSTNRTVNYNFHHAGDTGTYVIQVTQYHRNDTSCKVFDTLVVKVYDKIKAVMTATDTNECDPDHVITFINNTQYPWEDLGLGETYWTFGNTRGDGGATTARGDNVQYTYGATSHSPLPYGDKGDGYGDYRVMMTGTTPYGCPMDTAYQYIHIFRMHAVAAVYEPAPPSPPEGCAPLTIGLVNIPDSLVSSSPITSFVWRWDFENQWDINDTTEGTTNDEMHIYEDTGKYKVALTLTNEQGCVHDIEVANVKVGYPPIVNFTFAPDTGCKDNQVPSSNPFSKQIEIKAYAYDSITNDTLEASAWADNWSWLDDNDSPIGQGGDTATISPNEPGDAAVRLIASHNGCAGEEVRKTNLGYLCPPIGSISAPTEDPPPPTYCGFEYIPFEQESKGAIQMRWYAGNGPKMAGVHDTVGSDRSPLLKYDTIRGDYIRYNDNGDSVGLGGNWGFEYGPFDYLYDRNGEIKIYLWSMNDSSVFPHIEDLSLETNPYYNRCGYCGHMAEQVINISDAKMNFTVSQESICQGDSVIFNDLSECTVGIFGWGFKFDWAADPSRVEDWMRVDPKNPNSPLGRMIPIDDYEPDPSYGNGQKLIFEKTNRYRAVLIDTSNFTKCNAYTDTLYFDVYPQSIPDFISSTDSIHFDNKKDTICINADGLLYFRDNSWSPFPYEATKITEWNWNVGGANSTDSNPTLQIALANLHTLDLSITNEYGCKSAERFYDQVLANMVIPRFTIGIGGRKEFCNKEPISFTNGTQVLPTSSNTNTRIEYHWDFGDGTDTVVYANAGQNYGLLHTYDLPNLSNTVYIKLKSSIVDPHTLEPIGCWAEMTDSITINRPIAKFSTDQTQFPCPDERVGGPQGRTVTFKNESLGNVTILRWNVGEGEESIGPPGDVGTIAHTYKEAGMYSVLLIATASYTGTASYTCQDSLLMNSLIEISGPQGQLTYTPHGGCRTVRTRFYPSVPTDPMYRPDSIVAYSGNGERTPVGLNGTIVSANYTTAGVYLPMYYLYKTVTFNGEKHLCAMQRFGEDSVYVVELNPSFDTNTLYCPDEPITFTNTTTYEPAYLPYDSVHWNFDNNETLESYDGNTSYSMPGKYKVALTMRIPAADTFCIKTKQITIEVMEIPDLSITPDTAISCDGKNVVFFADTLTALNSSRIKNFNWHFSNITDASVENVDTNTADNTLTLMFKKSGNYACALDVTFLPEGCVKTYYDTIIVFAHESPIADFAPNPEEAQVDDEFQFTDKSTFTDGNIVKWVWNFGDGNVDSSGSSVIHAYSDISGYIDVTLYITDEYECTAEVTHQVLVVEKLQFPNALTPDGNCPGRGKCEFRPLEDKGFFSEFKLEIYDRWGMLVWSRHCESGSGGSCPDYQGDGFWWAGTNKQGAPVSAGVYYWVVYATPLSKAAPFIQNGSITVIR